MISQYLGQRKSLLSTANQNQLPEVWVWVMPSGPVTVAIACPGTALAWVTDTVAVGSGEPALTLGTGAPSGTITS